MREHSTPDPIRALLAQVKELDEKATGGPWDFQPWSEYALPSGDHAESILLSNASPDGEVIRGLLDDDGYLVSEYRTLAPQLARALEAVLEQADAMDAIAAEPVSGDVKSAMHLCARSVRNAIAEHLGRAINEQLSEEGRRCHG